MKLRNKKTGEIGKIYIEIEHTNFSVIGKKNSYHYNSIAELNEEWCDYEEPKNFYIVEQRGTVGSRFRTGDEYEKMFKEIGNYFETEEEAEKAVEKLKAWKRLKDKGFKIKGWKFTPDMKQIQGNYVKIEAEIPQILINEKDLDLLFGGEE